jgi:putative SOS response-associated peptidase YedK
MCYQTRIIKEKEAISQRFNADISALVSFNPIEKCVAFTFPETPVITDTAPNKVQLYHWGLIPKFSADISIRNYTLNARIETLSERKSFKDAVQNRCLIIADGFYEWQWLTKSGSRKQKYLITLPNEELFAFAGIYSNWENRVGQNLNTYTIITTQANELLSEIHNTKHRMPVVLKKEDEQSWLQGENYEDFKFPYSCNLIAKALK